MSFEPDTDLGCMDGLESVSLRRSASAAHEAIAGALRRRIALAEAEASGGRYLAGDVDWHLPSAALAAPPAIGAVLIDGAGDEYCVLRVERTTFGTRYVCRARSLSITGELDRLITIERATWSKGTDGAAAPT